MDIIKPPKRPSMDVQPPTSPQPVNNAPETVGTIQNTVDNPVPDSEPRPKAKKASGSKKIVIIILAVSIVVFALIGGLVYLYLSSKDTQPVVQEQSQQEEDDGLVDGNDVKAISDDISNTINKLNDSQDFAPSDLSDSTIGL